jgi:hypothetical protein
MITILNKSKEKYLYPSEINILQSMINNCKDKCEVNNKKFVLIRSKRNTATVRIYKITNVFFFLKKYILLTTLNIKYN